MAHVYIGPLGSIQQVQGSAPGGGGLMTAFGQPAGVVLIPEDSLPHVLIPLLNFVVGPTASPTAAFDLDVTFRCNVPSALNSEIAVQVLLDGFPLMGACGTVPPDLGAAFRFAHLGGCGAGPLPPGPHTLELLATSQIDVECQVGGSLGGGSNAQMVALWTE